MRRTGPGVLGTLFLLCALAGCDDGAHRPAAPTDQPALAHYSAPPGAPAFCTMLARVGSIAQLPSLLGRLSAEPWNLTATHQLVQNRSDLADVLATARTDRGAAALTAPLQDLVDTLGAVADAGVTEESAERIRTDLAAAGRAVQPACGYPT